MKIEKVLYLLFFLISFLSSAQEQKLIKLADKLSQLEKKHTVQFSYNHTFFKDIYIKEPLDCNNLQECLTSLQNQIPIKFDTKNGSDYMLLPVRKDITLVLETDQPKGEILTIEYQINNNTREALYVEDGVCSLKNIFPLDSIHIHSYSYLSIHAKAQDLMKTQTLKLVKKEIHLNQIVLNGYLTKGIDSKISDHSFQINTQALGLLAGETDGDLFNVISNIPGIHSPSGKSGNLNFRGSTFDQNLVQIDDIPIYHSGHFFGAISPYNTSVVTHVDVQRNALPVQWGGRVGGLVDMTTYDKIPKKNRYEIAVNSLFAGATAKTKLVDDKLSLILAARTSYPSFKTPKLEAISNLIFQGSRLASVADEVNTDSNFTMGFTDVNAKLIYKINPKHTATISFIDIQNHLSAEIEEKSSDEVDFRDLELDNWGITGKWEAHFSDKWTTEMRFSKSNMHLISESEGFTSSERSSYQKYDNTIFDTRLIAEMVYKHNPYLSVKAGYSFTEHDLISNEETFENETNSDRKQSAVVHSNYFSAEKNWKDVLTLTIGVHNHYYAPLKKFYTNPRITASYTLNKHWYLKTSLGTSNQFIQKKFTNDFDDFNITNQLWYLPNNDISVLKGTQSMIGSVFNKSNWLIDLELYQKNTQNITNKTDDEQGNLSSIGANLFVKRKWQKLETWLSYSLSKTETEFTETTEAFFDQMHVVNLTGILNLNSWKIALAWNYASGMPIIYADETDSTSNLTPNHSDRFDGLHQLDFSTSYTFHNNSKSIKNIIGLSILNVYNQDNTVNIFQNTSESTYRKASGFSPNLQWNLFF